MWETLVNNQESRFDIHMLTGSTWTEKVSVKFEKLVAKYNSEFHVHVVDEQQMANFPLCGHLTLPTYYNLCASDLLPDSIHRIIYMDGDMIVNGDIRPLWELDLQGKACAQVLGAAYYEDSQYYRLGFDKRYGVSNNGVVLYDLDKIREMNFSQKAIQFILDNPDKVTWMDQDAMNALLYDKTLRLPFYYNFQTLALTKERWQYYDEDFRKQVLESAKNPIVIHYTGRDKPWQFRYYGYPFGLLWDRYCGQSYWKNAKQRRPFVKYMKYLVKRLFWRSSFKRKCDAIYVSEAWSVK